MLADHVAARLEDLSDDALVVVAEEVDRRPERWRSTLRDGLLSDREANRRASAALLSRVGEQSDVRLMRSEASARRDRVVGSYARELARRIAPRVVVEDLGRVSIQIGPKLVEGSEIRRKVLALLCYLLSRPGHSASREEAIDALWPDQDPDAAMNSLNQTVYFLRRVFEPDYREDVSPGYLHQDGESLWLDQELVKSRSDECRMTIRRVQHDDVRYVASQLADQYRGRFALDFPYEAWAESFRDSLHAPYLRVMEHAIRHDIDAGDLSDGIALAERVHQVDSDSEEVQIALVRLYRLSGAFAAASEQYEHYAAGVRELGLEPTPLAEL
jgi:DNA-binding SARP family transcriptional activator